MIAALKVNPQEQVPKLSWKVDKTLVTSVHSQRKYVEGNQSDIRQRSST